MSEHCGYVVVVNDLHPHPNADRLQIATFFGNDTCVGLEVKLGQKGVYFPVDLQLSEGYCNANNLVRRKDENGQNVGGYLDPVKRNITALRLRGGKSDGLFMPIESLAYTGVNIDGLKTGDVIDVVNGHEICQKYIPQKHKGADNAAKGNKTRKKKVARAPLFVEHADTAQLPYNLSAFKVGDEIEITLKMHGTSQRTGYLPVLQGFKRTFKDKILRREGTPQYDWGYVTGTRRTVLDGYEDGWYGSDHFREPHAKAFEGKLHKGETAYYEVVGYTDSGATIMPSASNKKLNDKAFVKQYGENTDFTYGCASGESDFYVYRMTMTNEDGDVVEYTPDFMRYRCEQMGIKTVPVMTKVYVHRGSKDGSVDLDCTDGVSIVTEETRIGESVKVIAERYYDGPDPIGKTHVREGVVCRIANRPQFTAYKHKNFSFKCLAGIAIAQVEDTGVEVSDDLASEM